MDTENTIDIAKEVQSAMPAMLERMRSNIMERVTREAESVAISEVREAVKEWALKNIIPEINAQLEAGKAGMIAQAETIAKQLADALGEALTAQATKTLQSSHAVQDIAGRLFRGY